MKEEEIAALDCDWAAFTPAEHAAYALARKLTYEPYLITDADVAGLRKHYTDLQILEMVISVAGNNSTNRWKEGVGVPQSKEGGGFARRSKDKDKDSPAVKQPLPADAPAVLRTFLTPTAEKYKNTLTTVAPLQVDARTGTPTRLTACVRPPLETRAQVERALAECRKRVPRLPLVEESEARRVLGDDAPAGPLPQWLRLLANFPVEGKSRAAGFLSAEAKGDLSPLLKAQLSWIIARHDRAWYALGLARARLRALGWSDDQIFQLDGPWDGFTPAERALFRAARNLAASPIVLTDDDVARAVKLAGPRDLVQTISYTTSRASFNRLTEAAGLRLEE
jgi:alkylhydroperoxidase family enzyme